MQSNLQSLLNNIVMNNKNVFWGIILVVIGAVFIFNNLGWIDFSFRSLFDLWPALLVVWGVSILPIKAGLKTGLSIAVILLAVFIGVTSDYSDHWTNNLNRHLNIGGVNWDDTNDDKDSSKDVYT